ncbi:MAG: hypothetical protein ACYTBJ_23320, partial [Planctomycetota bacterium]
VSNPLELRRDANSRPTLNAQSFCCCREQGTQGILKIHGKVVACSAAAHLKFVNCSFTRVLWHTENIFMLDSCRLSPIMEGLLPLSKRQ